MTAEMALIGAGNAVRREHPEIEAALRTYRRRDEMTPVTIDDLANALREIIAASDAYEEDESEASTKRCLNAVASARELLNRLP